jgi:hypothetical protein
LKGRTPAAESKGYKNFLASFQYMVSGTDMSADTIDNLTNCQGTASKKQYAKRIRSGSENGIGATGKSPDAEKTRRTLDEIYGTAASEGSLMCQR